MMTGLILGRVRPWRGSHRSQPSGTAQPAALLVSRCRCVTRELAKDLPDLRRVGRGRHLGHPRAGTDRSQTACIPRVARLIGSESTLMPDPRG